MDGALTPTQERVLVELLGKGAPRPTFEPGLGLALRDELESALTPVADALGDRRLVVSKRGLAQVHACERHHLSEEEHGFAWSVATATGAVAHKAIELSATLRPPAGPGELVERALERLSADEDRGPGAWLRHEADPVDHAELRAGALDRLVKFADEFPPLKLDWRPRLESGLSAPLCAERIVLRGRVDLALGQARGTTAGVLIVDFKTGSPGWSWADDLRFYALLETLRCGVPPFRVATWYLDAGRWAAEDVTVEALRSAARRVVDGTRALFELGEGTRAPSLSPGPSCGWCRERHACEGAARWARS